MFWPSWSLGWQTHTIFSMTNRHPYILIRGRVFESGLRIYHTPPTIHYPTNGSLRTFFKNFYFYFLVYLSLTKARLGTSNLALDLTITFHFLSRNFKEYFLII